MTLRRYVLLAVISVPCCALPIIAQADEWIQPGEERFLVSAGVFLPSFNTDVQVNPGDGNGTDLDLEQNLGLRRRERTFWGGLTWRFASRHRISASYFQSKRDATATAERDLTIGDNVYPVGATLTTQLKLEVIPIDYSYSFIKNEKYELAGTLGLHWSSIRYEVRGSGSVGGRPVNPETDAKADGPLPLLGAQFDYHFNRRWTASALAQAFALRLNNDTFSFSGKFWNARLSTEYWLWNNVGAGVAVNWFGMNVDANDDRWHGKIDYRYFGPQVYLSARF
jgi:hypothetical protein